MINARLQLANIPIGDYSAELTLWGKNLADKDFVRSNFDAGGTIIGEWEDPLSYGIEATLYF